MFGKLKGRLTSEKSPVKPEQGKRLLHSKSKNNTSAFTIRSQKFPGFFFFFGLFFGGIPMLILTAIITGPPDPDEDAVSELFMALFFSPFLISGAVIFGVGLFLWLGKTIVDVGAEKVSVRRMLFGKAFQRKEFQRVNLGLLFEESHRSDDVPSYKIVFNDRSRKDKIGVGGSLREAELLWLEREIKVALGEEIPGHAGVFEAIQNDEMADIEKSEVTPNYRSKNLAIIETATGWEAQNKTSLFAAIGLIFIGGVFFTISFVIGGNSPDLFTIIFGGMGFFVILFGFFQLGYRKVISKRHSRLHLERKWFVIVISSVHELNDLTDLKINQIGDVNDVARFRLTARFKHGKEARIVGFSPKEDLKQLHARLRKHLPSLN